MPDIFSFTATLAIFWFIIYWLFGGVFFASVSLFKLTKLKKVRFSCLFTLATAACAFGAARTGLLLGEKQINICLEEATDVFERLVSVIACGILEEFIAALLWFGLLLLSGMLFFYISQAENQSWIDTDPESSPEDQF